MVKKVHTPRPAGEFSIVDPRVVDPGEEILKYRSLGDEDLNQVVKVLESLRRWHQTSKRMSEESRRYMKLGEKDMRALRYAIAAQKSGQLATPGDLAQHLRISTASVTKLLDRLAERDHIRRLPHPQDRRSVAIEVNEETRRSAQQVVGQSHAARFSVAAELTPDERDVVIRFLDALSNTGPPEEPEDA